MHVLDLFKLDDRFRSFAGHPGSHPCRPLGPAGGFQRRYRLARLGRFRWLLLLGLAAGAVSAADDPIRVSVDASRAIEGPLNLWGHVNVSRRAPPPRELPARIQQEYGRPEVTRCWLMLDEMWDYRTDAYRFNYEINKNYYQDDPNKRQYGVVGEVSGLRFYEYLDAVSAHSETVMLNIRRYEREVLEGVIPWEKWKEVFKSAVRHYKQRCPNLRYIEVLNEPTAKNQSNLGHIRHYYGFYRQAYQAIGELNAELQPELPLLVGGSSGFRTTEAVHLIRDFARDPRPDKKLDFVSFHHYWLRDDPQKNLWQAAGMTALQYYARHAENLRLFPWVQYHSPQQIAFVQFDTRMRMTPYGAAVKMLRMRVCGRTNRTNNGSTCRSSAYRNTCKRARCISGVTRSTPSTATAWLGLTSPADWNGSTNARNKPRPSCS